MEKIVIDFKEELSNDMYLSENCKIDISPLEKYNVITTNFKDTEVVAIFGKAELMDSKLVLTNVDFLPTKFKDKIVKGVEDGLLKFYINGLIRGFYDKKIFDLKLMSVSLCKTNKK